MDIFMQHDVQELSRVVCASNQPLPPPINYEGVVKYHYYFYFYFIFNFF